MPAASRPTHSVEFATLNEKVDGLAVTVGKLAEVVTEERRNNIENTRGIYSEITMMRDRVSGAGRITWPLIVTTFTAALAFAAIVGGIGTYALSSESTKLSEKQSSTAEMAKLHRELISAKVDALDARNTLELANRKAWMDSTTRELATATTNIQWLEKLRDEERKAAAARP